MTAYEKCVYNKLKELHQRAGGCAVRTVILAGLLGKNDRTMRLYLSRLESLGIVSRRGRRGGWVPMPFVAERPA